MKTKTIRVSLILCALLLVCGSFFACSNTPAQPVNNTSAPSSGNIPPNPGSEAEALLPAKQDFQDYTYRMVFDGSSPLQYWGPEEGNDGNALNVAFYNRNQFLENYFNIDIELSTISSEQYQMATRLASACSIGEDFADAVFAVAGHLMQSAVPKGNALDLINVSQLNLGGSYWDQRIQQEYLLQGKLFTLEGDYTVYDELRMHVVLYNGDLYSQFKYPETYGSPYEMVRDGDWTLDTMLNMFKGHSDLNGDLPMTNTSKWGMLSETPFPYVVFLGTGMKNIEVQPDGSAALLFSDDTHYNRVYAMMDSLLNKIGLNQEVLFADASNGVLTGDVWGGVSSMFESNLALFRTTTLSAATRLVNMEATFGILPVPKYEKEQEAYYSWCSADAHMPLIIPSTALSHIEVTGAITEALCYFSKYMTTSQQTVLDAFYENMVTAKLCRNAEDYAMLQLIFANKTYDIDTALNVTGLRHKTASLAGKRDISTLTSDFEGVRDTSILELSDLISDMIKNVRN